jgi:hypothetical protein
VTAAALHALHDELGVILLGHSGQLANEGNCRPEFVIAMVGPGRYAGQLDAVLENPEELAVALEFCRHRQDPEAGDEKPGVPKGDIARGCPMADSAMSSEVFDVH